MAASRTSVYCHRRPENTNFSSKKKFCYFIKHFQHNSLTIHRKFIGKQLHKCKFSIWWILHCIWYNQRSFLAYFRQVWGNSPDQSPTKLFGCLLSSSLWWCSPCTATSSSWPTINSLWGLGRGCCQATRGQWCHWLRVQPCCPCFGGN